jgi:hypothetical protein
MTDSELEIILYTLGCKLQLDVDASTTWIGRPEQHPLMPDHVQKCNLTLEPATSTEHTGQPFSFKSPRKRPK